MLGQHGECVVGGAAKGPAYMNDDDDDDVIIMRLVRVCLGGSAEKWKVNRTKTHVHGF